MTFALCGTFIAADGKRDELLTVLLEAAGALSADGGCIQYLVGVASDTEVGVSELWETEAAHRASLEREDIRALIGRARPLIVGAGTQVRLDVQGGKQPS